MQKINLYRKGKAFVLYLGIFILSCTSLLTAAAISAKVPQGYENLVMGAIFLSPIVVGFLLLRSFEFSRTKSVFIPIGICLLAWLIGFIFVMVLVSGVQC